MLSASPVHRCGSNSPCVNSGRRGGGWVRVQEVPRRRISYSIFYLPRLSPFVPLPRAGVLGGRSADGAIRLGQCEGGLLQEMGRRGALLPRCGGYHLHGRLRRSTPTPPSCSHTPLLSLRHTGTDSDRTSLANSRSHVLQSRAVPAAQWRQAVADFVAPQLPGGGAMVWCSLRFQPAAPGDRGPAVSVRSLQRLQGARH